MFRKLFWKQWELFSQINTPKVIQDIGIMVEIKSLMISKISQLIELKKYFLLNM